MTRTRRGRLSETEAKLTAFDGDPNRKAQDIEQQLAAVRRELTQNRENEIRAKERFDVLQPRRRIQRWRSGGRSGPAARGDRRRATPQRRNPAVARDVSRCRNRAVEAVFEPVQNRATELLRRITPTPLGTVCFSESFLPGTCCRRSRATRALEEASGGEQEQVHLAVRLALADVLFADERQLMCWTTC